MTEANPETSAAKPYWTYLFVAIITLGIFLRVWRLDERPMHHDESIHATFAYQWYEAPDRSYYKYDPTYHGPFLYTITRWFYPLFGVGVAQARLFPLIFGIGCLFSALFFRLWLGDVATAVALVILAVSPLFTYYSRFLAHDMPSVFFAAATAAGLLYFRRRTIEGDDAGARRWLCIALGSLGLLFSIKAVAFLYSFIFLTFVLFAWAIDRFPRPFDGSAEALTAHLKKWYLALGVFFVCYGFFQTSALNHADGFLDGLYRKVLSYWWGQHAIERVVGPVTYHIRSMLLHELPVCLVLAVALVPLVRRWRFGTVALAALGALFLATVPVGWPLAGHLPEWLTALFLAVKVRQSADLFLYGLAFVFGILGAYQAYVEERKFESFLIYWTFSSLAIYSFVGEKAPWLTPHVLYPAALLASVYVARWIVALREDETRWVLVERRHALAGLAALALVFQLRLAYFVTYVTAGEPRDLLSQVHNTKDVRFVLDWMRRISLETGERTESIPIAIIGTPTWAFYFHLIEQGYKRFVLDTNSLNGSQRFVICDEPTSKAMGPKLEGWGYRVAKLNHSGWWVPEHNKVGWEDWIRYALVRQPAGNVGLTPLFVYFKPLDSPAITPPPEPNNRLVASPSKDTDVKAPTKPPEK